MVKTDMDRRIRLLPSDLVQRIAAGEVIERPASVVKELVDNSIDAGAKRIKVEVKGGGRELIRVTDDGVGMEREDVVLAFQRYATSKIFSPDDLWSISTLGFRGEALPSIASVSQVVLVTKPRGGVSGTSVEVVGGEVKEVKEVGAPEGTSVTVRNLFFNTPARRKFLKSLTSEYRQIADLLHSFLFAYPQLSLRLVQDGREVFNYPQAKGRGDRVEGIWGARYGRDMLSLFHQEDDLRIEGFISPPKASRTSGRHQRFFVNGRPITSRLLSHSLLQGYGNLLLPGSYPLAIIFLEVNPQLVDVNVHPTKREVKFSNSGWVHDTLARTVKTALGKGSFTTSPLRERRVEEAVAGYFDRRSIQGTFPLAQRNREPTPRREETQRGPLIDFWQVHNLYILTEIKGGLLIMDQHAAHERVLYEKALRNLEGGRAIGQRLLFPQTIELTQVEYSLWEEHKEDFQRLGFELRPFGDQALLIEAVPAGAKNRGGEELVKGILDQLMEEGKAQGKDEFAKSYACHGAIKSGDKLSPEEMSVLFDSLFATKTPYFCPHGRPTLIKLTLQELSRRFGR